MRDYNIHLATEKWKKENHDMMCEYYKEIGKIIQEHDKREDDKIKAIWILFGFVMIVCFIGIISQHIN
jgi:hypothetical protein